MDLFALVWSTLFNLTHAEEQPSKSFMAVSVTTFYGYLFESIPKVILAIFFEMLSTFDLRLMKILGRHWGCSDSFICTEDPFCTDGLLHTDARTRYLKRPFRS